jgi:hypothetical protein
LCSTTMSSVARRRASIPLTSKLTVIEFRLSYEPIIQKKRVVKPSCVPV